MVFFGKVCRVKCACCGRKFSLEFILRCGFERAVSCGGCGHINIVYCFEVTEGDGCVVGLFKIYTVVSGGYEYKVIVSTDLKTKALLEGAV